MSGDSAEPHADRDDYDDFDPSECWQCGGEGYIANCQDEIGCVDPESGCDLCVRRCRICKPASPAA